MSYSINGVFRPEKTLLTPNQEEREDLASVFPSTAFIVGQCPFDSPRDKLLFQLFLKNWVDQSGKCFSTCSWPEILSFGQEEHLLLKSFLKIHRTIQETNENGVSLTGHYTLTHLFLHIGSFFSQNPQDTYPIIALMGSYLQEVEHKFGWSIKNLEQLLGVDVSIEVKNSLLKRTASDVDCRVYPNENVSVDMIQQATATTLDFLTHRIYWNVSNIYSRAKEDQRTFNPSHPAPEWLKMRASVQKKSLKNLNFIPYLTPKLPSYSIVSFHAGKDYKVLDLSFIKSLPRNNLFSLDDSQLSLNDLLFRMYYELSSSKVISTEDCILIPKSQSRQPIDTWQHIIDQCCYLIRGYDFETYDSDAYLRYLSHLAKGGRSVDKDLERALFSKISLESLPELMGNFYRKHAIPQSLQHAMILRALFSLKEQNTPLDKVQTFWKNISESITQTKSSSLTELLIESLHYPDITTDIIYPLLHLLAILNLASPELKTCQVYLFFQDKKAGFEFIENYTLTVTGNIEASFKELQTLVKTLNKPALNFLQKVIDYLRPSIPFHTHKETALSFYKNQLGLDFSAIYLTASAWVHDSNSLLQFFGVYFSFICIQDNPQLFSLKNWIFFLDEHPVYKPILCPLFIQLLQNTPFASLSEAIPYFEKGETTWLEKFASITTADTLNEVASIIQSSKNNANAQKALLKKYPSLNLIGSLSYFSGVEACLEEEEWVQHACRIGQALAKTLYKEEIKSLLTLILKKTLSRENRQKRPFAEVFLDLILAYANTEGVAAASYFFEGINQSIFSNSSQKLIRICILLGEQFLKRKIASESFDFWQKAEKKQLWKYLPPTDRHRISLAVALQSRKLLPLSLLEKNQLKDKEIKDLGELIISAVEQQDVLIDQEVEKILKTFSKNLYPQDIETCITIKAKKCFQNQDWVSCAESVKKLSFHSIQTRLPNILPPLLKGLSDNKSYTFLYSFLTDINIRSLLIEKEFTCWRSHSLIYLNSAKRPTGEVFNLLTIFYEALEEKSLLTVEEIEPFILQTTELLKQLKLPIPDTFKNLLLRKLHLILSVSKTPLITLDFLSSLLDRKMEVSLGEELWELIATQCLELNDLEKAHQLLLSIKNPPCIPTLETIYTWLTDAFIQKHDYKRCEAWLSRVQDPATLLSLIKDLIERDQTPLVLKHLEKLKEKKDLHKDIHSVIPSLVNHPKVSPTESLRYLMDFDYPVCELWIEVLNSGKGIKNQEPRFLKTLHSDASFSSKFQQNPRILSSCFFAAAKALSISHNLYLIEFCQAENFWKPLIQGTPAQDRLTFFEGCLNGLFFHLKNKSLWEKITPLIWFFDEKIETLLFYTNDKDLVEKPSGLGWKKRIAEALVAVNDLPSLKRCEVKLLNTIESQIDTALLSTESISDFEKVLLLLAKKRTAFQLITRCADRSFPLFQSLHFEKLFEVLSDAAIYPAHDLENINGYGPAYFLIETLLEGELHNDLQKSLLKFIRKTYSENYYPPNLDEILCLPFFEKFNAFSAEIFSLLLDIKLHFFAVSITSLNPEKLLLISEGIDSLCTHFKGLDPFPEAESRCFDAIFFLLLTYFGVTGDINFFEENFIKLLEPACIISMTHLNESSSSDKLFDLNILMLKQILKTTYKDEQKNSMILQFMWKQILFLIEICPAKHEQIFAIVELAICTPLVNFEDYNPYLLSISECKEALEKSDFFLGRPIERFKLKLYLTMSMDDIELAILTQDDIAKVTLALVDRLLTTRNPYQLSKAIIILNNLHYIGPIKVEKMSNKSFRAITETIPYVTANPYRMLQIYENLMAQVEQWPLLQLTYPLIDEHIPLDAFTKKSAYYNLTTLFLKNRYFFHIKWNSITISLITKWIDILCKLYEKIPNEIAGLYCVQFNFLVQLKKKDFFKGNFQKFDILLQKVLESYLRFIKVLSKTVNFAQEIEALSPIHLFPSQNSHKEEKLLRKTFDTLLQNLKQIDHPYMGDFIKLLEEEYVNSRSKS